MLMSLIFSSAMTFLSFVLRHTADSRSYMVRVMVRVKSGDANHPLLIHIPYVHKLSSAQTFAHTNFRVHKFCAHRLSRAQNLYARNEDVGHPLKFVCTEVYAGKSICA